MGEIPCVIRGGRPTDGGLILNSWLKGFGAFRRPEELRSGYFPAQKWVIADALERSIVLVACAPENEDAIRGYAIGQREPDRLILHWVYVRKKWRGDGIARDLVRQLRGDLRRVVVSHCTTPGLEALIRAKGWQYAPLVAYIQAIQALALRQAKGAA